MFLLTFLLILFARLNLSLCLHYLHFHHFLLLLHFSPVRILLGIYYSLMNMHYLLGCCIVLYFRISVPLLMLFLSCILLYPLYLHFFLLFLLCYLRINYCKHHLIILLHYYIPVLLVILLYLL